MLLTHSSAFGNRLRTVSVYTILDCTLKLDCYGGVREGAASEKNGPRSARVSS
jgi:hypothetical protein